MKNYVTAPPNVSTAHVKQRWHRSTAQIFHLHLTEVPSSFPTKEHKDAGFTKRTFKPGGAASFP